MNGSRCRLGENSCGGGYIGANSDIVSEFGFTSHAYADDTQLYISVAAASCQEAIERFAGCLEAQRRQDADHLAWHTASAE